MFTFLGMLLSNLLCALSPLLPVLIPAGAAAGTIYALQYFLPFG